MICRNSQPFSTLLGWHASKPGSVVNLASLHLGGLGEMAGLLHFNVTRYRPEECGRVESVDVYVGFGDGLAVRGFVMINGYRECVMHVVHEDTGAS